MTEQSTDQPTSGEQPTSTPIRRPVRTEFEWIKIRPAELRRRLIGVALTLVAAVVLGGFNVWYTNHVHRNAQHELCGVIVVHSDTYRSSPPSTETGRRLAGEMERLRRLYDC